MEQATDDFGGRQAQAERAPRAGGLPRRKRGSYAPWRGPHVRFWLRAHGYAGTAVAEALGLTWRQMYQRLRGELPFSVLQARALAQHVQAPYEELFPGDQGVDAQDLHLWRLTQQGLCQEAS